MPSMTLNRAAVLCAAAAAASGAAIAARAHPAGPPGRTGQGPHVRVELIADRATPAPGMRLGLKFDLDPGWHIYWLNPGDSGEPPEARWTLPPGLAASGFEWPAPERIDAGGLVNYGYHGGVVLPSTIAAAAPGGAAPPGAFTAGASVRWMVCADMCVPGRAELALAFPLAAQERARVAAWKAAIDEARSRVPAPAPASWKASARSAAGEFVLEVATGSREAEAVFFPLDASQVNDSAAQAVTPLASGVRVTLRKSSQLVKDPAVLKGVLALAGRRAHVVEARVRSSDSGFQQPK